MPDNDSASDKTEEATPRRLEQQREKGQVAKSRDLAAAVVLLGAVWFLKYGGRLFSWWLVSGTRRMIREDMGTSLVPYRNEIIPLAHAGLAWLATTVAPFLLALFLVALVAHVAQAGFLWSSEALSPKFNKLNPVANLMNMFKLKSFVQLGMNILKMIVVGTVAYYTVLAAIPGARALPGLEVAGVFRHSVDTVLALAERLAYILLALGTADFLYQRRQHLQDNKMTKQEVKEEYKDLEGSPEVKQKRRQKQRELAQQRMMKEVPGADVVVRNPTHFAVALRYDRERDAVPRVVAKGKLKMAERIIEIATEAGVPCLENKELARALYAAVEVGDPVPAELFKPVAEIMAHAYQISGKSKEYQQRANAA